MQLRSHQPARDDSARDNNAVEQDFAVAMARLGPFGPAPRLALAVSGGADSMALALLAKGWAEANKASVLALIVDHGLRAASAAEAVLTAERLGELHIPSKVLPLSCAPGPALQARARVARHQALAEAARAAGYVFLLFGHHATDQAETVAMRAARGGGGGVVGMAGWAARRDVLLLRPLLEVVSDRLKTWLQARRIGWIDDPSNADARFERVRLRAGGDLSSVANTGPRQAAEREAALFLAKHAAILPEGFAIIGAESAPPSALAALLRMIGGGDYAPAQAAVTALAVRLRPTTLGGVQIAESSGGWLLAREPAACAPPVPAAAGQVWDRRFRLRDAGPNGALIGALGHDAAAHHGATKLPALVRRGMPCLRLTGGGIVFPAPAIFAPPVPAASHPFFT